MDHNVPPLIDSSNSPPCPHPRAVFLIKMSALTSTLPAGTSERVAALRSLPCIRARCGVVFEAAKSDKLTHFRLDLSKLDEVATFVQGAIHVTVIGSTPFSLSARAGGISVCPCFQSAGRRLSSFPNVLYIYGYVDEMQHRIYLCASGNVAPEMHDER